MDVSISMVYTRYYYCITTIPNNNHHLHLYFIITPENSTNDPTIEEIITRKALLNTSHVHVDDGCLIN